MRLREQMFLEDSCFGPYLGACRTTSIVGAIVLRGGSTHCFVTSTRPKERRREENWGPGSSFLKLETEEQKDQYCDGNTDIANPKHWPRIIDRHIAFLNDLSDMTEGAS